MRIENAEYLRKMELVAKYPKYSDMIQAEVDRVSHRIKNIAALEWRITYKVASAIERGFDKFYTINSVIKKSVAAEFNRTSHAMATHNVATFTTLERKSNEGESITFDAVSPVNIEDELLRNETINLVFNFASNDIERAMVYGMMDGLTDAEIGRRISEMDDNKYTLQAYRKAVRKFRLRCADALSTEV